MGKNYEGMLTGQGLKFGLVVSRFNEFITGKLFDGAKDALKRHGVDEKDVDVAWVPGAMEIPLLAHKLAGRRPTLIMWPRWSPGASPRSA